MVVAAIGFNKIEDIDAEMQKLIAESQCYLFYMLITNKDSIAAKWAESVGAPTRYIKNAETADIIKNCDFLLINLGNGDNTKLNNLFMAYKQTGKHGRVIRN